ncbi:MAG: hypothetical protein H0X40_00235 [Chthoniobacterales bacterium]|nr:hypothetical protein [Chthoniobacterales bacterium]
MNTNIIGSGLKLLFLSAVALPSFAVASGVFLQKAPPLTVEQAPQFPENLARYHFGADVKALPAGNSATKLELSSNGEDRNTSEAALLCDDPTTGYQLPAGRSSILVSLANIENIASVSFLNDGAKGHLAIAISNANVPADSPEWHAVDSRTLGDGAVAVKVGPGEAKYVRLSFDIVGPGRIADFGVFATPAVSDFTMPRPRKVSFESGSVGFALINYSFTDLHVHARALYASSGDLKAANRMIDDQPGSTYLFAAGDSAPTAVIDLGRECTLSRISAIYAPAPGTVEFYVLNTLPANAEASDQSQVRQISNVIQRVDLPSSIKLSDESLATLRPVGSVVSTGKGRAAVDFPETKGRYLMLKWHPASVQGEAFSVAQVAAFGPSHRGQNAQDAGRGEQSADATGGKEIADGKSILDNKDIPREGPGEAEAPAEGPPPSLPGVPPFTFIPQAPPEVGPVSR